MGRQARDSDWAGRFSRLMWQGCRGMWRHVAGSQVASRWQRGRQVAGSSGGAELGSTDCSRAELGSTGGSRGSAELGSTGGSRGGTELSWADRGQQGWS